VVCVGYHPEDILEYTEEILLVETVGDRGILARKVIHDLSTHCASGENGYRRFEKSMGWIVQFRPMSAMSRMVCLMAQMTLSIKSLNCGGGRPRRAVKSAQNNQLRAIRRVAPSKQQRLMARNSLKKPTRCSGNSVKSLLIMLSVGSNTASKMAGT
jgi:hypothetical protein